MRSRSARALERSSSIEETEAENARLLEIVNSLEAELQSWNSKCEQLEAERASLSATLSDLEWECETLEEDAMELERELGR